MKNIMLIAVATLTIATAHADWFNWQSPSPIRIVNNTNVTLELLTEPDDEFLTVPAGKTVSGSSSNEGSTYLGWGIDAYTPLNLALNKSFDDQTQQGTMADTTASISGAITLGQVWGLNKVGDNDNLVFTGTANGNNMQLTATRTQGPTVARIRSGDSTLSDTYLATAFCLNTGVEFNLNVDNSGRCPIGETDVLLASYDGLLTTEGRPFLDDWTPTLLEEVIRNYCVYNVGCRLNPYTTFTNFVSGQYIYGFDKINYSSSNNQLQLKLTSN